MPNRTNEPEPLGPGATGLLYAFLAMLGTATVIGVGLAIALEGVSGLDGVGPIFFAMLAGAVTLPTAAVVGFFYGRQRGRDNQMEHLAAMEEPLEPSDPPSSS